MLGVKMYDELPIKDVLIAAGFHDPAIPSLELAGRTGAVALTQKGPIPLKVGVWLGNTSME